MLPTVRHSGQSRRNKTKRILSSYGSETARRRDLGRGGIGFAFSTYKKQGYEYKIQAFMHDQGVAIYKWPERMELIDAIPRNPTGKILKAPLRERLKESV